MSNSISAQNAIDLLNSGEAILIDVREADEFKNEHIAHALSIPLSALEDGFSKLNIPTDKTIIFQCLKGTRGQMACERVTNSCDNKIVNIDGGINAWKEQKFPVISNKGHRSGISIFRQVQIIVGFLVALCVILGFTGITTAYIFAGLFGAALCLAGLTGWCGLAILLSNMPWNK